MSIEITKEMLLAAKDYIPIAQKGEWVSDVAEMCFERYSITYGDQQFPPMYGVNTELKSRFLMGFFIRHYLGIKEGNESNEPWLMPEDEYDKWAASHVFGQLDRWKHDAEVRDKCFDLLADYKDLEKRLSSRISGLLAVQNDFLVRSSQDLSTQMQALPSILKALEEMKQGDGENAEQQQSS